MSLDTLVRTVWGEARNQDATGQQAVASVILNRAKQTGRTVDQIVREPGQFEPWGNPTTRARLTSLSPDSPEYQRIAANIAPAMEGQDPTGGADHFYSPKAQAALGRPAPKWDDGRGVDLGDHRFFRLGYKGGGAPVQDGFDGADIFGMGTAAPPPPAAHHASEGGGFDGSDIFVAPAAQPKASPTAPVRPPQRSPAPYDGAKSELLGFKSELARIAAHVAPFSPANLIPGFRQANEAALPRLKAEMERQAQVREPGKIGAFGADVYASAAPGANPVAAGMLSGLITGTGTDAGGVAKDVGIGALTGRLTALGSDALQVTTRKLLSKAPGVLKLPDLKAAKQAAYDAVDNSGFSFGRGQVQALVADFEKTLGSRALSKSAKEDAASVIAYARSLAKGDLPLSQLDKLRTDIYDSMVAKGGDTANIGGAFRAKIDGLISTAAKENQLVRNARDLNARWKKADYVNRASQSADLAAERTYGGDYGRKLKDRMAPLVDPLSKQKNFRGATPDETAALNKVARGTKTQNLASAVGGMTDPRRMGGKILAGALSGITGTAGIATGGATVPLTLGLQAGQVLAGLGLTAKSSKIARKNLDALINLISAGGSKQALKTAQTKSIPTQTSHAVETAIARLVRPAAVAASVPALAATRAKSETRPRPPQKPKPR